MYSFQFIIKKPNIIGKHRKNPFVQPLISAGPYQLDCYYSLWRVRCGRLATLQEAVAAHRLLLFGSMLSNNKYRIERLRRSRLHPRPEG
jgi:hypothetical protein